jgi:lipoyl(octanoyl) transferase
MIWKHLSQGAFRGAMNMAIDEALLELASPGEVIFRTYTWDPPTLSLGTFQKYSDVNLTEVDKRGFDVVRRATGGRAVLHDKELTYSIIMKAPHKILESNVLESYYFLCQGLVAGLRNLGVDASLKKSDDPSLSTPSCFAAPTFNDIEASGKKLVGSAQMRNKLGLLQHGSILIDVNLDDLFAVISPDQKTALRLAGLAKSKITSINNETGRKVDVEDVREAMVKGFENSLNVTFEPIEFDSGMIKLANELQHSKYGSQEWTKRQGA